jgi:nitric oxide reductase NorE protein
MSSIAQARSVHEDRAPSILVFIGADLMAFAIFFVCFMAARAEHRDAFAESARSLNLALGVLNTLILVTSSWLVVISVHAARAGAQRRVRRTLALAMLVACGFAVTKGIEYGDKFSHGISIVTSEFFTFYFLMTGVHFLHFLVGMAAWMFLWVKAGRERVDGPLQPWIISAGLYWHMVDLLWLFLFPLLYLLRSP